MIKTPLSTVIGGAGIWTPSCTVIGGQQNLTQLIKSLFSNNKVGFAYDPNDLTTLYQDAAGTIPVTAAGQPVGLVLDKSNGLVLGPEMWNDSLAALIGESQRLSPGVYRIYSSSGAASGVSLLSQTPNKFKVVEFTVDSVANAGGGICVESSTGQLTIYSVGRYRVICSSTFTNVFIKRLGICDFTISNVSVKELSGNHAYQTVSASRPILQRNATTGAYYLVFDGADDFLQTNSIDFTATDKVSLFAGVMKNVNAINILCELSANMNTNTGGFYLTTPESTLGAYGFKSCGSAALNSAMTALSADSSPIDLAVLSAFGNISTSTNTLRKNKIATTASYPLGTGNYGNYPLYIGRRAGTSLPFNGHLYSLIGIGHLTTDSETTSLEKSIAKNVGVTL